MEVPWEKGIYLLITNRNRLLARTTVCSLVVTWQSQSTSSVSAWYGTITQWGSSSYHWYVTVLVTSHRYTLIQIVSKPKPFLTFQWPMFTYANTLKTHLTISFIYLGNKDIYCTWKAYCIISVWLPTKCCLLHLSFSIEIIPTFFSNKWLKFK